MPRSRPVPGLTDNNPYPANRFPFRIFRSTTMRLDFVPQHRDDTEAAPARFPGEATDPRSAGAPARPAALGWACAALVAATSALLLYPRGYARAALWSALAQADRIDHPVFITGILLTAIGGAMVVVPLVYLLGLRRAARPVIDQAVRVDLGDECLTVRLPAKELTLTWDGVVAFAETRHLFVLKTVGDLRLAVPKRAAPGFDETPGLAADALRDLLRRRIAPVATVAPPAITAPSFPPRLAA